MNRCLLGDCRDGMRQLIADGARAQMSVTSPPYWGLRDYGHPGQLGLESTPAEYVANMVDVFRLVRGLLADDGVLWLNLGDSYAGGGRGGNPADSLFRKQATNAGSLIAPTPVPDGLKPKDLVGIPWRVAFALQADGWYLRSDIIWHKPNPMPESVTDRPTKAHEYLFLMSKQERYFYDADAIKEPASFLGPNGRQLSPYAQGFGRRTPEEQQRRTKRRSVRPGIDVNGGGQGGGAMSYPELSRNKRSVWTVPAQPYADAHFATFPPALIEPCILAGSRVGDVVFDPFLGSGTTAQVAQRLGRQWLGCELSPEYHKLIAQRSAQLGMALA